MTLPASLVRNSRESHRGEEEVAVLLDHGLHGGRLLLLNLLRERRESGEAEQSGDRERFNDIVHRSVPFVRGLQCVLHPVYEQDRQRLHKIFRKFVIAENESQTLRFTPKTHPAQRSACAPSRPVAPQARQVREERTGRPLARQPARAQHGAAVARPGASEFHPQRLIGPLEAEVRPFDLALGFAVLPEHKTLDVVRPQILAQALERPRRVLDDALAVLFVAVVGERVGVALEVRSDGLVCAVGKPRAACVVVGGEVISASTSASEHSVQCALTIARVCGTFTPRNLSPSPYCPLARLKEAHQDLALPLISNAFLFFENNVHFSLHPGTIPKTSTPTIVIRPFLCAQLNVTPYVLFSVL